MRGASGRLLLSFGVAMLLVGFTLQLGASISLPEWLAWLGKLPGDFRFHLGGFRLEVPVASCAVISVVATLLLQLFRPLR